MVACSPLIDVSVLLTCRSHKGSNLALMVELLAGPLVGAAVADKLEERNWGNLILVVDPELLGDKEVIKARTQVHTSSDINSSIGNSTDWQCIAACTVCTAAFGMLCEPASATASERQCRLCSRVCSTASAGGGGCCCRNLVCVAARPRSPAT